jgi:hypothetical protein
MKIGQQNNGIGNELESSPARSSGSMSPIEFRLDPASGVPTYLQLVHQVEHALRLGYLKPGDQLPKVRDVVASLAINPNTVSKAYGDAPRADRPTALFARLAGQSRHGGTR